MQSIHQTFVQAEPAEIAETTPVITIQNDCDCIMNSYTEWDPVMGTRTAMAYTDQNGRRWGFDASCGGQIKGD